MGQLTLSVLSVHLSAKNVEQVGGRGHVGNLHVAVLVLAHELLASRELSGILVAELEVSLETTGRVLRALTVITVG